MPGPYREVKRVRCRVGARYCGEGNGGKGARRQSGSSYNKTLRQHRIIPALRLKHRSGGCRTSLAVSALRIMRYCPNKKRTLYRYSVLFVIQQFEDGENYLDFSSSRRSSRSQTPSMYCTPRARSYLP